MQNALIDALQRPAAWHDPVDRIELIETHASWVLLAGDTALKIKKPVDFGFLDFSTLQRRRHFCEEEIRLNRRTAPMIYRDVVEISGTPEKPEIGGTGAAIEYAVRMHRFDPGAGFDRLLSDGQLTTADIDDLAKQLAALHREAAVAPPDGRYGTWRAVAEPMLDNFDSLAAHIDDPRLNVLRRWTVDQLHRLNPVIEQRLQQGFVRECHGDAHLGNVARIDDRATLFDCIEFNPDFRWTDVICDLAFTVMNLRDRGAEPMAWRLLDVWLAESGDYDGLRLLPLYMVYRAMVRAKVHALRLAEDEIDRAAVLVQVGTYLNLAETIRAEHRPALLLTTGLSGSGKSWLAERLVARCGLVRIRSDVERKRLHGLDAGSHSSSRLDAGIYSAEASKRTYRRLLECALPALETGIPVLLDAAFLKQAQREPFLKRAEALGVPFGILECHADPATLKQRIEARAHAGNDPSEANLGVLSRQQATAESLTATESAMMLKIETSQADATERAANWIRALFQKRQETIDG
ncbi:MAG: AAA family ATPase [Gammaproteobacteria bacterium]|nr:AAA family ATPase [Gammaproteobacteria bacterium]